MNTLRAVGLVPVGVTLQFDREEGGVQALEAMGLTVNTVTAMSRTARYLLDNERIGNAEIDALAAYYEQLQADGVATTYRLA
jgi:orotate phosphoribosyltransferase